MPAEKADPASPYLVIKMRGRAGAKINGFDPPLTVVCGTAYATALLPFLHPPIQPPAFDHVAISTCTADRFSSAICFGTLRHLVVADPHSIGQVIRPSAERDSSSSQQHEQTALRRARPCPRTAPGSAIDGWACMSVILLHGGVNASQHMMKLGHALADAFTVYLPDRRGRG